MKNAFALLPDLPEPWETTIADWLAWLTRRALAESTLRQRNLHLRFIARWSFTAHPSDVNEEMLRTIVVARNWSSDHRKTMRTSLYSFYEWAIGAGVVTDNPVPRDDLAWQPDTDEQPAPRLPRADLAPARKPRVLIVTVKPAVLIVSIEALAELAALIVDEQPAPDPPPQVPKPEPAASDADEGWQIIQRVLGRLT